MADANGFRVNRSAAPLRVCFLTHYYPPEVGAAQGRISALARELRTRGVDVTIHTGFPNYPIGRVHRPYRNRPLLREVDEHGLRIVRSAVLPTANRGFLLRLANHTAFASSSMLSAAATGPQDVVVVETPPLFSAGGAVPYARCKRAPLIVHVSDVWPLTAVQVGAIANERALSWATRLERWIYASAEAITVPTRGMVRRLGVQAPGKVRRMPPVVDLARFPVRPVPPLDGPLRVLYAGTIGLAHGLETLVEAAAIAGPQVVELTMAGWGAEWDAVRATARRVGALNVTLLGTVPPERVVDLYARAHAGAVLLRDRPVFAEALPTKLYECMAAARPLVAAVRGEAAEAVHAAGAGLVVAPEDSAALARAFAFLRDAEHERLARMGRCGRAFVEAHASLEASVDRWMELLAGVTGRNGSSAGVAKGVQCGLRTPVGAQETGG